MLRFRFLTMTLIMLMLTACGATQQTTAPTTSAEPKIQAVLATSNLVAGAQPNRLPIGLVVDGTSINEPNAKVHLKFYFLSGTEAQKTQVAGESDAQYYGKGLPVGIYVTYPTFPVAGAWGVEVEATLPNQAKPAVSRLRIDVLAQDPTPALGSKAIPVDTPTVKNNPDLSKITSDAQPNPALYQISVSDALKNGKPTVILFGTPGFCKTATCGPSIKVLGTLQKQFGDQANFIHVEVYQYPFGESVVANPPKLVPAMAAWGLQSEPWLFIMGKDGTILYKYEGGITLEETEPVMKDILQNNR